MARTLTSSLAAAAALLGCAKSGGVHGTSGSGGASTTGTGLMASSSGTGGSGAGGMGGGGGTTTSASGSTSSSGAPTGPCAGKIGTYCGSALGMDPGTLYGCNGDAPMVAKVCAKGCVAHGNGADACACPDGDGLYCGAAFGQNPTVLYDCQGGVITQNAQCIGACVSMSPGVSDTCGTCPSGNGVYCGAGISMDPGTLYNCTNGVITVDQKCQGNCQVNGPGVADTCGNGMCPQGNGAYCGGPIGKAASTLYDCNNGTYTVMQVCPTTCHASPPGQADYCDGSGQLMCSAVQWWNAGITYGPYQLANGGLTWWDTDLAIGNDTPVQLRHDSKLVQAPVEPWGWQPRFVDMVTGKTFQFLHLHPQDQYTTAAGTVYPAGTIVGLSGGGTADTGFGTYSTGPHLCVETLDTWQNSFPKGNDPCH